MKKQASLERIEIRMATAGDAEEAIAVLRASIIHLCADDHQGDEYTLNRWLRNKTPDLFLQWITKEDNYFIVAAEDGIVCGVGALSKRGDLDLCYVMPGMQSQGVGRLMLEALEAQAWQWGLGEIRLLSTAKARGFYEKHGYVLDGEPVKGYGVLMDYKYLKKVQPTAAGEVAEGTARRTEDGSLVRNRTNAAHYGWGDGCDGWRLHADDDFGVIEELVPPGRAEVPHRHTRAGQVFVILEGEADLILEGGRQTLRRGDSLHVPAGALHEFRNDSPNPVRFLVISAPRRDWDRIEGEHLNIHPPVAGDAPADHATFHIRPMLPTDYAACHALWTATENMGDAPDATRFARFLALNPGFSLVAEVEGRVIGALLASFDGIRGYFYRAAVDRAWRRHGTGTALVAAALAAQQQAGALRVNLHIFDHNQSGLDFWSVQGWTLYEGLLVLQKELS